MNTHNPFTIEGADDTQGGRKRRIEWVESSDHDFQNIEEREEAHYLGRAVSERRLRFVFGIIPLLLVFIFIRVFVLNQIKSDTYVQTAERNRLRARLVVPERGMITDRTGIPLAVNVPNFVLLATPADLPSDADERTAMFEQLSMLGFTRDTVRVWRERIDQVPRYSLDARRQIILADRMSYDQAILFETFPERQIGLSIELRPNRSYPASQSTVSFGHLIGYMGRILQNEYAALDTDAYTFADMLGRQGLEASYEKVLRGIRGIDRFEVNAKGVIQKLVSREPAKTGAGLRLTIDATLQRALEERLTRELKRVKGTQAAAIALDPRDGSVRALVSLPAYDNNLFAQGISSAAYTLLTTDPGEPLFPRAIAGEYPSGSTVKPVIAAAALAEGIITRATSFLSQGGISVGPWFFPDWKKGGHGSTNVYKAIAESVNTFFYIIGGGYRDIQGLGIEKIVRYAAAFGLGSRLGIDIPGERSGFLPSPEWKQKKKGEQWYIGDTYHMAIGQGDLLVTPLQVAVWTSIFANGGTLFRPHLVEALIDTNGRIVEKKNPEIVRSQVVDATSIGIVRRAMRETVLTGSARRLLDLRVSSAGKTGTAEWSSIKDTHAWFTAFAPYENPEIVITVLIQEGGEGSASALPVAHDFLQGYFSKRNK